MVPESSGFQRVSRLPGPLLIASFAKENPGSLSCFPILNREVVAVLYCMNGRRAAIESVEQVCVCELRSNRVSEPVGSRMTTPGLISELNMGRRLYSVGTSVWLSEYSKRCPHITTASIFSFLPLLLFLFHPLSPFNLRLFLSFSL